MKRRQRRFEAKEVEEEGSREIRCEREALRAVDC
jgi:hypothetical protein